MKEVRLALAAVAATASALLAAAPSYADPDTDFANEPHTYGIYGGKGYNAWIGKIACKRLDNGLDQDADKLAQFVFNQLEKVQHHRAGPAVPGRVAARLLPR
jgi:hypothetical protein